jgi:hypothetical protein
VTTTARTCLLFLGAAAAVGACTRYIDAVVVGAGGAGGSCTAGSTLPDCAPTPWPISGHSANSDPWIATHNQVITVMKPEVLILNFENGATAATTQTAQTEINALADASRYQGYSYPARPQFLQYKIAKVVDLTDNPPPAGWTNPSSTMLPTDATGAFDPLALFSAAFADLYAFPDASNSRSLTLCELFETGAINELWIQDGEPQTSTRHAPYYQERKQVYDLAGNKVPGSFKPCAGGTGTGRSSCLNDICAVTVRIAHLDPTNTTCGDLEVRGWGIEGMWDALPAFQADANAFLNRDFAKFGVQFSGWPQLCDSVTGTCVTYPNPDEATGSYANLMAWTINPFRQGCGDTEYPSNATRRYDYANATTMVDSRCAHFGMRDGTGGEDKYEIYTYNTITSVDRALGSCGGGWQTYWRQSMPGLGNTAIRSDGAPMDNWWPMLFY